MGFMTFCASISDNCTKLNITDTTGVYNATTNTTGWQGGSQPNGSDVTSASIMFYSGTYDPDTRGETVVVTSNIPATVVGEFTVLDDYELDYSDGAMTIVYTVTTATATYRTIQTVYFTCNVRCCVDKMWKTVAENCGDCTCTQEKLINDALVAEGLLMSIKAAASCNKTDGRDRLLAKIERLCEFNDCNCN